MLSGFKRCWQHLRGERAPVAQGEIRRAVQFSQGDIDSALGQANEHLALDEPEDARDCFELVLAHVPDCVPALVGLTRFTRAHADAAIAREQAQRAVAVAPDSAELHFEAALTFNRAGDTAAALAAYERALELQPDYSAASTNLGLLYLSQLGDPQRAQNYFERALAAKPGMLAAEANLGLALDEQGRHDDALAHFAGLIEKRPDVAEYRWNRGLVLLGRGEYARAWDDYELRNARGTGAPPRQFPYPAWQGEALGDGALLVYGEQGVGDEMMFASCLPDLLGRSISCVVECEQRLAALFARSFPAARVHGAARDGDRAWLAQYPGIRAQIAIGSLPQLLRRDENSFPRHAGYLRADAARADFWRARVGAATGDVAVGIAWRGGTVKTRQTLRSIPPASLAPLFKAPQVNWVSLQRDGGEESAVIAAMCGQRSVAADEALQDLDETAALIAAVDCVVTADNTIAHLAGALGRTTMVMLPASADWRWRSAGPTSPWYPSVQLYRQQRPGDWTGVVAQIAQALQVFREQR